jgi:hypothetical protein
MTKYIFLEKARNKHGYKYKYLDIPDRIKLTDKIKIEYNGITFMQVVSKHLQGKCPEKKVEKKTTESFIKDCKLIWGNKYDYSLVEYKGSLNNIKIIYDGVIYEQRASSHLNGMSPEFRKNEDSIVRDIIRENEFIGNNEILSFLNKYKLNYSINYKIDNIVFDYYLPSIRTCIEFNGKHHYQLIKEIDNDLFEKIKISDKTKIDYCEDNYLNLIIIKYDQIDDTYQILWNNLGSKIIL